MDNLKFLELSYVHLSGGYKKFPKDLRWLCWHGFSSKSIPSDLPLERLAALEMSNSNLNNVWKGSKVLELLKILNLSHSHCLVKTPKFSTIPNLERLILENCTSLVEIHDSVGCLEKLILLNLKGCKKLRNLPRSIGMLRCLETLDISDCSNLEFPTEMRSMESLKVLNADGIAMGGEVDKPWYSFMWSSVVKLKKSPRVFLPHSLVELSLGSCNLSDDDFPRDLSGLSSLQRLILSNNPICSPDYIRGLTRLRFLDVRGCSKVQSVVTMSQNFEAVMVNGCTLLESVTSHPSALSPLKYRNLLSFNGRALVDIIVYYENVVEVIGRFRLQAIGNVDVEIINSLGLREIIKSLVKYSSASWPYIRRLPLQGCHEAHSSIVYIPGSKVPPWFNITNRGSSMSFTVASPHDSKIRGLSVCFVYKFSKKPGHYVKGRYNSHMIISNRTKRLTSSFCPRVFGIPEEGEEMMWLSYLKSGNLLESGDELDVLVVGPEDFQVKEIGVRLLYKEEQEVDSTQIQLACEEEEEEVSQQIHPYGNVLPGDTSSSHPTSTIFYRFGIHGKNEHWKCRHCPGPFQSECEDEELIDSDDDYKPEVKDFDDLSESDDDYEQELSDFEDLPESDDNYEQGQRKKRRQLL